MQSYKQITFIDPLPVAKIAAMLGAVWAVLGWLLNGIVIATMLSGEQIADLPPAFSISGLFSGLLGGVIGSALAGLFGAIAYNLLAKRIGGIRLEVRE